MKLKNLPVFVLLNLGLWSVASVLYFYINGFPSDVTGIAFAVLLILAYTSLVSVFFGLVCAALYKLSGKYFPAVCILLGTLVGVFFAVDIFVFSQYRFHVNMESLSLFFGPAGREIFILPTAMWGIAAGVAVLLAGIEWMLEKTSRKGSLPRKQLFIILGVWALVFVSCSGLYTWGQSHRLPSVTEQCGVLPYGAAPNAKPLLRKVGVKIGQEAEVPHGKRYLHYPLQPLTCASEASKNVLVIVVNSWRADSYTPIAMPKLTNWAQQNGMSRFSNHISGGNNTKAGMFSLFYGLPFSYWKDFTGRWMPPLVMAQAQKMGYTFGVFSGGRVDIFAYPRSLFANVPDLRLSSKGGTAWQRDENAVEDFEKFLDTSKTPFFGTVILDSALNNSYPPGDEIFAPAARMNYFMLTKNADSDPYMNRYRNSVYFIDKMIDRILNALARRDLLGSTMVVITGDHGKEINDTRHNFWGSGSSFSLYQTHVPMFVWLKGSVLSGQRVYATSHYDVAPTILSQVFKCTTPLEDYTVGQDLFDTTLRPFTLIFGHGKKAVRTGNQLTVTDDYGNVDFYDEYLNPVENGADPEVIEKALGTQSRFYY